MIEILVGAVVLIAVTALYAKFRRRTQPAQRRKHNLYPFY
jgi:hypothetical protein